MIFVCLALQLFTQEEHNVNKTLIIGGRPFLPCRDGYVASCNVAWKPNILYAHTVKAHMMRSER
jgi:hypothetical protein